MSGLEALEYAGAALIAAVAFLILMVAVGGVTISYQKKDGP